jgi:GGDEF domain-containing protein
MQPHAETDRNICARCKLVNDRFGHAVGDRTLQIFADAASA